MVQGGTWAPYAGAEALRLAAVLLFIAGALALLGIRLHHPVGTKKPGLALGILLVLILILAVLTLTVNLGAYGLAWLAQHSVDGLKAATNPITPITYLSVIITFIVVIVLARDRGPWVALGSGIVAAMAGPMVFELPFDLIVISRLYYVATPVVLYTLLYFLPLFLIELTTFALLTLSPAMQVSRYTLFSLAAMFLVFAIWAWFGFSEPSTPLPIVFNGLSKVLAFATVVTLFLPAQRMEQTHSEEQAVQLI